jgi:diguanylate cyclase (GGDEF)-like protein
MTLASSISLPEIVARYGGDEFAVLLPESHRAMAVELTTAIIEKLDDLSVFESDADGKTGATASFAIVSYPEDGSSREELLAAAEMSLEQSKEERRAMRMPKRQLSAVQQLRLSGKRRSA